VTLYRENPKESTKILSGLTNAFSKIAEYIMNTQKNEKQKQSYSYTLAMNNLKRKLRALPFAVTSKRVKYL
jgi:hypothetical protein